MFLHLLLFFSQIGITLLSLGLPSSEMPTELFFIVKLALVDLQNIGPILVLILFFLIIFLSHIKLLQSFLNFLYLNILFIFLILFLIFIFSLLLFLFLLSLFLPFFLLPFLFQRNIHRNFLFAI